MKICIVLNVFTDEFVQNLTKNALLFATLLFIIMLVAVLYYGFTSQWFAKLFGSARSVTQSRIALQDYRHRIISNFLKTPLPLNGAIDEDNGTITPATIIENAIQSLRKFSDKKIKNWRELHEADIYLIEETLQLVIQEEILLRLEQYANDGTSIIDCMKSINEFWKLVTKGIITENGEEIILYPETKTGYGVNVMKEPERPVMTIDEDLVEQQVFDEFLAKLKHQMAYPDMTMEKIENILKASNMSDTPIVFQSARQILADKWMELFGQRFSSMDQQTTHETLWELYEEVVKMKKTVDLYEELVDISENLIKKEVELLQLWEQKYRSVWEQKFLAMEGSSEKEILLFLTEVITKVKEDESVYFREDMSVFYQIPGKCFDTAFELSNREITLSFLKEIREWLKTYNPDYADSSKYENIVERIDSFLESAIVPMNKKLRALKEA